MAEYSKEFGQLAIRYAAADIEFSVLKSVTLAQWILESGRGTSKLAGEHKNFAGLKWRSEMKGYAEPVEYDAHDGTDIYCKFSGPDAFIAGYWHFLERSPYNGWRDHADDPEAFIRFISKNYTPTMGYADAVLRLVGEANALLAGHSGQGGGIIKQPGTSEPARPPIKQFIPSPHCSSRNGERIRRIILHYTTSRNVEGTIAWFQKPESRVSAHYVIARTGEIYQMVRDSDKAWHAKNANADSIGIEHSAAPGDQLTSAQTASSISLIRWLLSEYKLSKSNIHGHQYTPENAGTTDCPGEIFGPGTERAVTDWVNAHI